MLFNIIGIICSIIALGIPTILLFAISRDFVLRELVSRIFSLEEYHKIQQNKAIHNLIGILMTIFLMMLIHATLDYMIFIWNYKLF